MTKQTPVEKVALVTGVAGGIGSAIGRRLAREGVRLVLVDIVAPDTAADKCRELGTEVLSLTADVSSPSDIKQAVAATVEHFGALHIVANVAGICPRTGFEQISAEEWDQVLAVNLKGPFLVTQAAGHVGLILLPKGPAGVRCAYAGGFTFAIPRSVQDLEGALTLLRFLTSYESHLLEARGGTLSTRSAVHQEIGESIEPGLLAEHRMHLLDETVSKYAIIPPKFPSYPQVEDTLWETVQAAILDKLTVDEALSSLERKMIQVVQGEG